MNEVTINSKVKGDSQTRMISSNVEDIPFMKMEVISKASTIKNTGGWAGKRVITIKLGDDAFISNENIVVGAFDLWNDAQEDKNKLPLTVNEKGEATDEGVINSKLQFGIIKGVLKCEGNS